MWTFGNEEDRDCGLVKDEGLGVRGGGAVGLEER